LPKRDSSFLKVAHRTQGRAEEGQTGRRPRASKASWHWCRRRGYRGCKRTPKSLRNQKFLCRGWDVFWI